MIDPPNYSRSLLKATLTRIEQVNALRKSDLTPRIQGELFRCEAMRDILSNARHFALPSQGIILDDKEFRGLDESVPLRLPFPAITLEFPALIECRTADKNLAKIVITAVDPGGDELSQQEYERIFGGKIDGALRESGMFIMVAEFTKYSNEWAFCGDAILPRNDYLLRPENDKDQYKFNARYPHDGDVFFSMGEAYSAPIVNVIFGFLNALSCSNVGILKLDARQKGKKGALPFDDYHVLVLKNHVSDGIDSGMRYDERHRPREHIRRGHIRRYPNKKIWVNNTVVNAGIGNTIRKDYALL